MDVSKVGSATGTYKTTNDESKKTTQAKEQSSLVAEVGATYEKTGDSSKTATYSVTKMSAEERSALITQLKADQESRANQLTNIVAQMMGKQSTAFANATDMWKLLASGEFSVDAATKAQAQEDISEDGYWGVKQTSQRLFDFASALAGDDVEKMKEMQAAMQKGFEKATATWGRELPQISQDTMSAANQLFEDYYASKA